MLDEEIRQTLEKGLAKGFPLDLQMRFAKLDTGVACLEMPVEERFRNIYGMVHGGVLFTLMDTSSGFAVRTFGDRVVTLNGSANYLRAGKDTAKLICKAAVVKKGRGTAVVSAEVYDDSERLLANGTFTFYVLQAAEEKPREQAQEDIILETPRLYLRKLCQSDVSSLCETLQDEKAMYAYEHAFSDEEVRQWLGRQLGRYEKDGFGLWAVILKESGEFIGQCGLTMQECSGRMVPEIGYLFRRDCWHKGYATEAAQACKKYAFETLGLDEVYSIIRDNNLSSRAVAERNGMQVRGQMVKHYYGMDMPHLVYSVKREDTK